MSRNTAAMNPGRTNRRFIFLAITLGLIGAILVYVASNRDSTTGGGSGDANTPVVVAKTDIPARTKITASMVEVRFVTADAKSALAFAETDSVIDQVTRFPITANEQMLSSKIVDLSAGVSATSRSLSFVVPQGKRAIAVKISQVQSAGGLVLPGDYVDILFVSGVTFNDEEKSNYFVRTLFQNVEVLAVQQGVVDTVPDAKPEANGQIARNSEAKPDPAATTVTLALTPEEAQWLYLAELNGEIRLTVRHYGEGDIVTIRTIVEDELIPPNLPAPTKR